MKKESGNTPRRILGFTGTTTDKIIAAATLKYAPTTARIVEVLNHQRFEEFAVVALMIKDIGGLLALKDENPNHKLLELYFEMLASSIQRSMNQGVRKEQDRISTGDILAARDVVLISNLKPHKRFEDLPALEDIDGASPGETLMDQALEKYDRNHIFPRSDEW